MWRDVGTLGATSQSFFRRPEYKSSVEAYRLPSYGVLLDGRRGDARAAQTAPKCKLKHALLPTRGSIGGSPAPSALP